MEQKEKENREEPPIGEDDPAGSGAPPEFPANGRILVKLKLPKTSENDEEEGDEEEEEVAAGKISPAAAAQEIKSHYCKECNKSFSSGKALGGHMSSAHVQANKDYSYKKLNSNSKMKRQHKASGTAADNACMLCGKAFRSKKSLFGHMRCHPEREWRGMEPPAAMKIDFPEASSEPELEDVGQNQDEQIDSWPDGVTPAVNVGSSFRGWPTATKRGRGLINPVIRASSEERETFVAGRQLIRLLEGESGKQKVGAGEDISMLELDSCDLFKKQKMDSGVKIHERNDDAMQFQRKMENNGKGKEKVLLKGKGKADENRDSVSTMSMTSDEIDSDDELYLNAIEVLTNGKRAQIESQKPVIEEKMDTLSPEKYICNVCNRSFPTHQALGGHRSSHNKFKLSIFNTADRRQSKDEPNAKTITSNVADDDNIETGEKAVLDFDLNIAPEEEEDKDVDGHPSDHTSNS